MLGEQDARSRSLGVRPPFPRGSGGGSRKSLRGMAVAPYLGETKSLPQRGSNVVRSPSLEKTSPTRRRANSSVSLAVRGLDLLGPLESLTVLRHQGDALNDRTDSRNSPRRGSYVLLQHNRQESRRNRLVKSTSLKNFKELSFVAPKLPGAVEGSPEKIKSAGKLTPTKPQENSLLAEKSGKPTNSVPPLTIERQPSHLAGSITFFGYSLAPLYESWERLQVSHCGQYSVERMLALDEYCQRVSFVRVVAVCLLFPIGPLVVVVLAECMPLQPVEKGPLANYVFWIRHTLMGALLVVCAMVQAKSWIPDIPMALKQVMLVAIGSALVYTAACIAVADLWVFPVPFLAVAGAPLMFAIWATATRLVLGARPLDGIQDGELLGRQFLLITSVHASLLGIYPAYQALFLALDSWMQLGMIALLPGINLALKNIQTALGAHLEDNLPEVVTFSVDVFSAIYSVLCMHSANSMKMVGLTLVLNASVMLLSLHGMSRRSGIARSCRVFQGEKQQQKLHSAGGSPAPLTTLVDTTLRLLQAPDRLDLAELRTIRLLSGMPQKLSISNKGVLNLLATRSVYNNSRRGSETASVAEIKEKYSSAAMEMRSLSDLHIPVPPTRPKHKPRLRGFFLLVQATRWLTLESRPELRESSSKSSDSDESESERTSRPSTVAPEPTTDATLLGEKFPVSKSGMSELETRKLNTRAVKQTLQLLFTNEYLGLIAYTQCIMPLTYLLYMPVLQALPNHIYYPTHYRYFASNTEFNERMTVIGILSALQFVVLMVLQVAVVKRFGISTLYQVAFVLESRLALLQCRLLMWLIFAVQSTLVHYGVDFSFRFDWLHKPGQG